MLECEAETYTFVTPNSSLTVSNQCNEDFLDRGRDGCKILALDGYCGKHAEILVELGVTNADGVFETALNCPQCGCGADGAVKLYDRLADSFPL